MLTFHYSELVYNFLDLEGGSQKASLVVLIIVIVISSVKIPQAFLIRNQSSFHVINLKLDIEPSLTLQRTAAAQCMALRPGCCSTVLGGA